MSKSYFKRFGEWQNYLHYGLLSAILSAVAYYYNAPFNLKMFLITFVALLIGDSLVHLIFHFAPKPIQWRD